jgi:hypothetical protein
MEVLHMHALTVVPDLKEDEFAIAIVRTNAQHVLLLCLAWHVPIMHNSGLYVHVRIRFNEVEIVSISHAKYNSLSLDIGSRKIMIQKRICWC